MIGLPSLRDKRCFMQSNLKKTLFATVLAAALATSAYYVLSHPEIFETLKSKANEALAQEHKEIIPKPRKPTPQHRQPVPAPQNPPPSPSMQ